MPPPLPSFIISPYKTNTCSFQSLPRILPTLGACFSQFKSLLQSPHRDLVASPHPHPLGSTFVRASFRLTHTPIIPRTRRFLPSSPSSSLAPSWSRSPSHPKPILRHSLASRFLRLVSSSFLAFLLVQFLRPVPFLHSSNNNHPGLVHAAQLSHSTTTTTTTTNNNNNNNPIHMTPPGELGPCLPATPEIQALIEPLRLDAQTLARLQGFDGSSFAEFVAIEYRSQVFAAGTNYFVKVRVSLTPTNGNDPSSTYVHLRIFKPLPSTHSAPRLVGVKVIGLDSDTPLESFVPPPHHLPERDGPVPRIISCPAPPPPSLQRMGGTGPVKQADAEIQLLCDAVRKEAQRMAQAQGWNGLFTEFTAVEYMEQVVAGVNYFVKVKTGDGDRFAHVRIYKPLPYTNMGPSVAAIKPAVAKDDPLEYFTDTQGHTHPGEQPVPLTCSMPPDRPGMPSQRPGGTGPAQPATPEIQHICESVRIQAQQMAQAQGWNGVFTDFTAIEYMQQVVAGINYFVKVRTAANQFAHVRIYKPLPYTNLPPTVSAVKPGLTDDHPLQYFAPSP